MARQTILVDESLTNDEKSEAIRLLTLLYDYKKRVIIKAHKGFANTANKNVLRHYSVNFALKVV